MPKRKIKSKEPIDELEELQGTNEEFKTAVENISSAPEEEPEDETVDKRCELILAIEDDEITQSV